MEINFSVPGVPIAQPRQRVTVRDDKARTYTPTQHPVNSFKAAIQLMAREIYHGQLITTPVVLRVWFVFPRTQAKIYRKKPMPEYPHVVKPDGDNCVKAVKDALTGVVWRDDSQVWKCEYTKVVAEGVLPPRTDVRIQWEE